MSGQVGGAGNKGKIVEVSADEVEDSASVARATLGLSEKEIAETEAQMQMPSNAKTTARAKSVDMGGLSLLGDLEAKLAAKTAPAGAHKGADAAGPKWTGKLDPAALGKALEQAFPGKSAEPTSGPDHWVVSNPKNPDEAAMFQISGSKLRMFDPAGDGGPSGKSVSVDLKPGDDMTKALKGLNDRVTSGDWDKPAKPTVPTKPPGTGGIKPPPKGGPTGPQHGVDPLPPGPKAGGTKPAASDKDISMGLDMVRQERGDVVAMSLGKVLGGFQVEPGAKPLTWVVQSDEVTNYEVKIKGGKLELKDMATGKTASANCPAWEGFKAGDLDHFLKGLEGTAKQLKQQTAK